MSEDTKNGERRIRVDVSRYESIAEILSDKAKATRAALLIAMITCVICIGVAITALLIKRIYPYNNIETNIFGATTVSSESKDVAYWLFNTAELWADSGIQVEAGDVLTIHASGKCFSAMHHLYDAAKDNRLPGGDEQWVGTEGILVDKSRSDSLRRKWRIVPNQPTGMLLMKVVRNERKSRRDRDDDPIYVIGKESVDLYISTGGTLKFAVNDIVLTDDIIYSMIRDDVVRDAERLRDRMSDASRSKALTDSFAVFQRRVGNLGARPGDSMEKVVGDIFALFDRWEKEPVPAYVRVGDYRFGPHPEPNPNMGDAGQGSTMAWNELRYYHEHQYTNAWYDDNIGSFLIVVERKKSR